MRLINTETGEFEEFLDSKKIPPYAILSHTWDSVEQTYQQVVAIQESCQLPPIKDHKWGALVSEKVRKACEVAFRHGYRYIWIDSCCIDKTSSSELSEAINSMFNWYQGARICYAFLKDVSSDGNGKANGSEFLESVWFTRGWTLQELLAPRRVVFLSKMWEELETKDMLADVIKKITSIDPKVLIHERALSDESVADRMRWASKRKTTRIEDEAYSLLGIFGITMPTLYGEGRYAFRRLQEEILQRIPDQSLFAWGSAGTPFPLELSGIEFNFRLKESLTLFAPSPDYFLSSSHHKMIRRATGNWIESLKIPVEEYTRTPFGIRTQLCLLPLPVLIPDVLVTGNKSDTVLWHLVIFRSQHVDDPNSLLSRLCYLRGDEAKVKFLHLPDRMTMTPPLSTSLVCDVPLRHAEPKPSSTQADTPKEDHITFTLSVDNLRRVRTQLLIKTVYLPHFDPFVPDSQPEIPLQSSSQAGPTN